MSSARYLAAFLLLALSAALARADGLLYQLPKDGRWASYDFDASVKMAETAGMNLKGTLRMASVGQATEEKQPCRWIEIELGTVMTLGENKMEKSETYKLLIPEKFLAKGQTPLEHVVRAWTRSGQAEPKKLDKPNSVAAGPLPIILSGPWKDVKQLDKAEVKSKLGKLACKGVEGTLEFKMGGEGVMKCKFENRLHADSPFGVVTSHWTLQPDAGPMKAGPMEWNFKLADFGDGAKSKLPDAK